MSEHYPRESTWRDLFFKRVVTDQWVKQSPLFYTHVNLWCHLYATLSIAILYNPRLYSYYWTKKTATQKEKKHKINLKSLNQGLYLTLRNLWEQQLWEHSGSRQAITAELSQLWAEHNSKNTQWWSLNTLNNLHTCVRQPSVKVYTYCFFVLFSVETCSEGLASGRDAWQNVNRIFIKI